MRLLTAAPLILAGCTMTITAPTKNDYQTQEVTMVELAPKNLLEEFQKLWEQPELHAE